MQKKPTFSEYSDVDTFDTALPEPTIFSMQVLLFNKLPTITLLPIKKLLRNLWPIRLRQLLRGSS